MTKSDKSYDNNLVLETDVWLVVLGIYVALAIFQPFRDLEAGVTNL